MDTMEWSFQTLQMIDMMQTIEIMDDPRYEELNPIFRGRTDGEVYALFLTGSILHYESQIVYQVNIERDGYSGQILFHLDLFFTITN